MRLSYIFQMLVALTLNPLWVGIIWTRWLIEVNSLTFLRLAIHRFKRFLDQLATIVDMMSGFQTMTGTSLIGRLHSNFLAQASYPNDTHRCFLSLSRLTCSG